MATVPRAQARNIFSVATRLIKMPPTTRPTMKSSKPPIDRAQVACMGVMKPSSVMKLMKKVLIDISEIS